jgi:hypothetical protein
VARGGGERFLAPYLTREGACLGIAKGIKQSRFSGEIMWPTAQAVGAGKGEK